MSRYSYKFYYYPFISVIFYLLNKGDPVNEELLERVISHLYESVPQSELQELASITVQEVTYSSCVMLQCNVCYMYIY